MTPETTEDLQAVEKTFMRWPVVQLLALRRAFTADLRDASLTRTREFCRGRIDIIDRVLQKRSRERPAESVEQAS